MGQQMLPLSPRRRGGKLWSVPAPTSAKIQPKAVKVPVKPTKNCDSTHWVQYKETLSWELVPGRAGLALARPLIPVDQEGEVKPLRYPQEVQTSRMSPRTLKTAKNQRN